MLLDPLGVSANNIDLTLYPRLYSFMRPMPRGSEIPLKLAPWEIGYVLDEPSSRG